MGVGRWLAAAESNQIQRTKIDCKTGGADVTPMKQVDKMRQVWYNNNKEKCIAVLDFAF